MADKPPSKRFDKEPSASSSSATLEANDDPAPPKRPASTRTSARSDANASGRTSARTSARGPAGGGGNAMTRMAARRSARRKRQEEEAARLAAEAARPLSAAELVQRMSEESAKKKQEREDAKIREEEEAVEKTEREAEEKAAAEEAEETAKRKAEEQEARKAETEARKAEREARKADEGEDAEDIEEAKPRFKLHWSLKLVAFFLLVFLGYLGFLWATTGHVPALHTAEGRDELVRDVKEDWATLTAFSKVSARDLDKYLEGKPPETKEQIAALVDESKEDLAADVDHATDQNLAAGEEHKPAATPKPDATNVDVYSLRKAPTDKKVSPYGNSSSNTTASRPAAPRSGSGSNRGVKVADPRLATARDIYQKAIALYVQADPRSADSATVQKYLKQAKPLFEQVLDECDKAAAKGVGNGELDRLQRDAAMRLYDCNKRTTL